MASTAGSGRPPRPTCRSAEPGAADRRLPPGSRSAAAGHRLQDGADPLAVGAGGTAHTHAGPLLRPPDLDDRPADRQLDLPVELGGGPVRLDGMPGVDLDGGERARPPVRTCESDGVLVHIYLVPCVTTDQSQPPGKPGSSNR